MSQNPFIEIDTEPEVTSFDARKILAGLRDSVDFHTPTLSSARKQTLYDAIFRVTYDSDVRHLIRAIAAKGLLPYYGDQYVKMYVQIFGFERQGLISVRVDRLTVSEALISNMLAAADHIYWAVGSLCEDVFKMLHSRHTDEPLNLNSVLNLLNNYSGKILRVEKDILEDKALMRVVGMTSHFGRGIQFDAPIIDRSYRNNPHWTDFTQHFQEQRMRIACILEQIHGMNTHPELRELLRRLDSVGS